MRVIICLLTALFFTFLTPSAACHAMNGTGVAFKVRFAGTIYKRLGFLVEEDIRPKSDFSQMEWYLTTAELNYKLFPNLRAGVGYMSLAKYNAPDELRNRYYFYAMGHQQWGNVRFSVRERFQSTFRRHTPHPTNYSRSMLMVSYQNITIPLSSFAYIQVFNRTTAGMGLNADKILYSAGMD